MELAWEGREFLNEESSLGVWYLLTSLLECSLRYNFQDLGAGVWELSPACREGLLYDGSLALEQGELAKELGMGCLPHSAAITEQPLLHPSPGQLGGTLTQNCPLLPPVADSSYRCR